MTGTTVTLAANNFATQVTADTTVINFDETKIVVDATVNGETSTVTANEAAPQVIVTTDTGAVVTTTNNVNLSKVEAVVTEELTPTVVKPGLAPLAEREAAAPEVTTTTTAATSTTVAAVATTVVASDPKPTTTPTTAALSAVPTAPANSPLRNDVSYAVGDPVNITIPNVKPGVWLQLILSSPTRVLQTVQANSAGRVVFKTIIPVDTKVSTSGLRPRSVKNSLFYDLIVYSNLYKEYNQKIRIEVGPVLKTDSSPSATTTTTLAATATTVRAITTTVAPTTATTTTAAPSTTVRATTTTVAPTTTVRVTTTTAVANNVTLKFTVVGTGWNPNVKISTGRTVNDQDYDNMDLICTSASTCQGATKTIPYGNYFFFDISTDQAQSYTSFGSGAGLSNTAPRIMSYRVCDSDYPGYASKTCEIILYKNYESAFYG